jgi:tetratricopeptide (TPR) repeat protein
MTVEITRNLIPYTKNFGILRTHYNQVFSLLAQYFFKKNQTGRGVVLLQEFFRYPETEKQSAEAAAKLYYQTEVYPLLKNQELEKAIPRIEKGLALTGNRQTVLMDVYKNTLINYGVEEYRKKNLQRAYGVYKKLLPLFPKDAIVRKNFLAVGGAFLQSLKNNQPGEYNKVAKEIREMREKYRF